MRTQINRPAPAASPATPGRRKVMNKTESRFAMLLEAEKRNGAVLQYEYEAVTLKLGHDLRYTPDFFVVRREGYGEPEVQFIEVKGTFMRDDARAKLYAAATQFPHFRFTLARYEKGSWTLTEVPPR